MKVEAAKPEDLRWLEARAGCVLTSGARGIRAVDAHGRTRGVVAYDNWTPNACQAHMAVDTPIAWRHLARPTFAYPFIEAGRSVLLGTIPASNTRSLRMAVAMGLRQVHRVKDGWAKGEDMVVLEMRREDCRWISQETSP